MIYRKRGQVVRWENGTLIRVTESGAARETGDLFECWPVECGGDAAALESGGLAAALHSVRDLPLERVIVSYGVAEHEYGDRTWRDESHRFHASLVHDHLRVLVDRLEDVAPIANALQRAGSERAAPKHLRLAPTITAALLPFLKEAKQTASGVDGYGNPVTETSVSFYRPSYRVRPVRMRFNLRLEHDVTAIDEDLPRAIALLAPVSGPVLRVLVEEEERVYPATVEVTKIEAVAAERVWYPYGAGSFGAEMML